MRILFLDFDGVLNSESWMLAQPKHTNFIRALDRTAVALIAEIVARTQAQIVVSSSWRRMYSADVLRQLLTEAGYPAPCPIIGLTPILHRTPDGDPQVRGHEIQQWLDEAAQREGERVDLFAILDDDSDMAHLRHRLVQTSFKIGLTRDHAESVIALLTPNSELRCRRCCSTDISVEPTALGGSAASFNVDCRTCGVAYGT